MTKIENALIFATKAHAGKYRKGTDRPYIIHPIEVMSIVMHFTDDEDVLTAAVLHDTVEDTAVTIQRVEKEFGSRVAELVASVTEDKKRKLPPEATWRARKWEMLFRMKKAERDVKIIWFADCLSNMRDIKMDYDRIGDDLWERFNQKDKELQSWYYRETVKLLDDYYFEDDDLFRDYADLVFTVFGHGSKSV